MVYVLKSNFCYSLSVAAPGRSEDTNCFSNLDKLLLMKEWSFAVSGLQLRAVARGNVEQGGSLHCKDCYLLFHIERHLLADTLALEAEHKVCNRPV
jgi:hypothetical protein